MKDDEILILESECEDEWYCQTEICPVCKIEFMCYKPKFCPGCGRKIVGSKCGNETVFYLKGDEK